MRTATKKPGRRKQELATLTFWLAVLAVASRQTDQSESLPSTCFSELLCIFIKAAERRKKGHIAEDGKQGSACRDTLERRSHDAVFFAH
jgi:hypothetical protein